MPKKRALWSEAALQQALEAISNGMAVLTASRVYNIPRRTLRNHVATGSKKKKLGRGSILSVTQERELCQRIFRLAEVGMPLTSKVLRRSVFTFVEQNGLKHPFSPETRLAGRKWMNLFYIRNPVVVQRKAQPLNPARAQKLNKVIVGDYFGKLKKILVDLNLSNQPQRIYNMDEKGCRLTLHHQQQVLAKKGAKRVHLIGQEHAENVTVAACGNALGQSIPPMVLFKGKRQKPEWIDSMPPGTSIEMTAKGSMTTATFIKWLDHFSAYKPPGRCLLIFDGAASHLDANIVDAAESHDVVLLCLPSNTTHELQPLDKSVFRSFEHFWDEEVLRYWVHAPERKITKGRFGHILSAIWPKAMSPENLMAGFRATGIYPFNPSAIPEVAFAPSILTEKKQTNDQRIEDLANSSDESNYEMKMASDDSDSEWSDSDLVPLSVYRSVLKVSSSRFSSPPKVDSKESSSCSSPPRVVSKGSSSCSSPSRVVSRESSSFSSPPRVVSKKLSEPSCSFWPQNNNVASSSTAADTLNSSFTELLPTPEWKTNTANKPRRKAINSSAQIVTKDLFKTELSKNVLPQNPKNNKKPTSKRRKNSTESWYCFLCDKDEMLDMRKCVVCFAYVHEACIGLTKEDKIQFICPRCSD